MLLDEQDMEAAWVTLRDTIYSTAMECLEPSSKRVSAWFDTNHAEIIDLIGKKCATHLAHLSDSQCTTKKHALRSICTVQLELREMQDSWLSARTDKIQGYTDKNDMKNFYSSLKEVHGPTSVGSSPLQSADETKLISEKNKIPNISMVY